MEKELFLKGMQELLEVAKAGGDKIGRKIFYHISEEWTSRMRSRPCSATTLWKPGCRWRGMKKARKRNYRKKRQYPGVIRFYEEELEELGGSDPKKVRELIVRLADGEDVQNELIESMLADVALDARNYTGHGVLLGDLIQEGNMVLIEAVFELGDREPKEAEKFLREAAESAMKKAVSEQMNTDSVGEQMARKANRLDEAARFLAEDLGREATAGELADHLKMTEEEVKEIMKMSLDAISVVETDITRK